ncbi:MAG TPA: LuxR C-terminal-related transcriptional regulator [Polyangiaceae bacterium]
MPERRRSKNRASRQRKFELTVPAGLAAIPFAVGEDEYVLFSFALPEARESETLTAAEREVVRALVQGRSNEEIARARRTSPNTVANQVRSACAKLRVRGRLELVRLCTSGAT